MDELELRANGLRFQALALGEGDRTALLLHGFPDAPHSMIPLARRLVDDGYRVVAPWMRGYGPTELPPDGDYQIASLAGDAVGLLDALGWERSLLVGHDWGALAAYGAANLSPHRITELVGLSVPPGRLFAKNILRHPNQWLRSWYIFAIQIPVLPEWWLSHDDFEELESLWRRVLEAGSPEEIDEQLDRIKRTFRRPGTLHAALGYYRALFPGRVGTLEEYRDSWRLAAGRIESPTLMIAGGQDPAVSLEMFDDPADAFAGRWELEIFEEAGHFVQFERPDAVADRIREFV